MAVYLLHFDQETGGKRHYCGFTADKNLLDRLDAHRRGRGANLTRRATASGAGFTLAHVWHGAGPDLERKLKQRGHLKQWCRLCSTQLDGEPNQTRLHFAALPHTRPITAAQLGAYALSASSPSTHEKRRDP